MNLKKYLPLENYVLTTRLSAAEVYNRLSENIQAKQAFQLTGFNRKSSKPYEGIINEHSFTISRVIDYRNSFLPVIQGNISTFLGQTQVQVKMKPMTFVLVFMSFWLGMVGLVCLVMLVVGILQISTLLKNGFSPMMLIPFGMLAFGALLTNLAFKAESKKSKEFLARLLDGEEIV